MTPNAQTTLGIQLSMILRLVAPATLLLPSPGVWAQFCPQQDRVLWVGDSWAEIQWNGLIVRDVFDQFGHGDKLEYDDDPTGGIDPNQTAISGMTAYNAADPAAGANYYDYPSRITNTLNAKPEIDIVLISLGGNDMIAGGWFVQGYPTYHNNVAANNTAIVNNINVVAQAALAVRPNVEVVIYGYDYVGLWEYVLRNISNPFDPMVVIWFSFLGNPPAGDFYDDLVDLETRKKALADGDPRIHYINNLGTMQNIHGHDTANWGVGITPRPDGTNFPATPSASIVGQGRVGTDQYGQPVGVQIWRSNTDWIHLSDAAYRELCVNATVQYFWPKFRGTPDGTFVSEGGSFDGLTVGTAGGGTGISSLQSRMGDVNATTTYRTIFSFDTSTIPDGATINKASVYFSRVTLAGTNPFLGSQGNPRLDVATGSFGLATLENADFNAAASANNVGCFTGSVSSDDYFARADFQSGGLPAINTTGRTQLRLYFTSLTGDGDANPDFVQMNDGDASNALLRPFLDVWYTIGTPTPTPTPVPTNTPTQSPTPSPTESPSPTPSPTASPTASPSGSPTASPSPTISPSPTPFNAGRDWSVYE